MTDVSTNTQPENSSNFRDKYNEFRNNVIDIATDRLMAKPLLKAMDGIGDKEPVFDRIDNKRVYENDIHYYTVGTSRVAFEVGGAAVMGFSGGAIGGFMCAPGGPFASAACGTTGAIVLGTTASIMAGMVGNLVGEGLYRGGKFITDGLNAQFSAIKDSANFIANNLNHVEAVSAPYPAATPMASVR